MIGVPQSDDMLDQINDVVAQLDKPTQEVLLKELKKVLILSKAKELDARIKAKHIKVTDAQIMDICRKARKKAHAA